MITVSCYTRKDLMATTLIKDGVLLSKSVVRVRDNTLISSNYLMLTECFALALRNLRKYLSEHGDDFEISFEFNNSTFIKWVNNGFSKANYQDSFSKVYETLQSIPLQYNLIMNAKPYAMNFCKEKYLEKVKLSGLE